MELVVECFGHGLVRHLTVVGVESRDQRLELGAGVPLPDPGEEAFRAQASGRDVLAGNGAGQRVFARTGSHVASDRGVEYCLFDERRKYVSNLGGGDYLYDLLNDPMELKRIPADSLAEGSSWGEALLSRISDQVERQESLTIDGSATTTVIDEKLAKELKSLGY